MDAKKSTLNQHRLGLVVLALVVGILYQFIPYGRQILFPFSLLFTWVHEMGHGVTALLVGGNFEQLKIFWDTSGYAIIAVSPALARAAADMGGLLAPPFMGMIILILARSWARVALWALSAFMLISLLGWVRSLAGFVSIGALCVLILLVSVYANESGRRLFSQFLGVVLALFTITRSDYLFVPSGLVDGKEQISDIGDVAQTLGGPYQMWGGFLIALSLIFLVFGLWLTWRSSKSSRLPKTS